MTERPFTPEDFLACLEFENARLALLLRLAKIRATECDHQFENDLIDLIFEDRWRALRN